MAEISAGRKQAMYPDNVAQQDISSSGSGFAVRTQIKSKSTCEKCGTEKSFCEIPSDTSHVSGQKFCSRSSNSISSTEPGGRDPLFEKTILPKLTGIPVKAVPMKRIPVNAVPESG